MTDPLVAPQEAVEAGARARLVEVIARADYDYVSQGKWDAWDSIGDLWRQEYVDRAEVTVDAFLAAGWLPPNSLSEGEQALLDQLLATNHQWHPNKKADAWVSSACFMLKRLAAGWTPPEGEKT